MQCHIAKHRISSSRNMHFGHWATTSDRNKRHVLQHNMAVTKFCAPTAQLVH